MSEVENDCLIKNPLHFFLYEMSSVERELLKYSAFSFSAFLDKPDYEEDVACETIPWLRPRKVPQEDSLYARIISTFKELVIASTMTHNLY